MSNELDAIASGINAAISESVQNHICDAVEQALDLAWKAHRNDFREALGMPEQVRDADDFREWFEPVRAEAAKDLKLNPTVAAFLARYLAG
ncbi:hypothetical protein OG866_07010 [Streptomyces sp. NBC_00663]|uniref:hypothetical protein n=1 Tax=Streptomyces sp. NBC_00663 TaxID=2975801 RepID=UPI002E301991|nr:hypothetical protein [Streptomyces sp. NBC_00663]